MRNGRATDGIWLKQARISVSRFHLDRCCCCCRWFDFFLHCRLCSVNIFIYSAFSFDSNQYNSKLLYKYVLKSGAQSLHILCALHTHMSN